MEDNNPTDSKITSDKVNIYNNFKYAFNKAFSKVMKLNDWVF
jgi:hypothetical protein